MIMRLNLSIVLLFFTILAAMPAAGQCCSAGNPAGGDGSNDGLNKNDLRLFASYRYSLSRDYFHLDKKIDVPYLQKSYYDYSSFSLTYGLSNRFSIHTELGYFIDKTQELVINNENETIRAGGLGDMALNIRYIPLKTIKPVSQLVFSAGSRVPVGAFNEESDGVTIPVSLQPSSGAFKYNAGVFYSRKNIGSRFGWNAFALFEISSTINKGFLVYDYGNYFQFALAGMYSAGRNLHLLANAKLEWRGKDSRESGIIVESSGSRAVFINPQVMFTFHSQWAFIIMSDIPLYKYVNGYQLTNRFALQVGIRRNISLCKSID